MSDIQPTLGTEETSPLGTPEEPLVDVDPELLALFEKLRPLLTEFTKVGIDEAQRSMQIPVARMGTCTGYDPILATATVLVDGDAAAVPIPVICEAPIPGDRVACSFWPGGTARVDGILGGHGMPSSAVIAYAGRVDSDGSTSTGFGPPRGFAWARGQVVKTNAAPGFFYRAGTTYNTGGEASDEVRLPDLRGRAILGLDNMGGTDAGRISTANTLGADGGGEFVNLTTSNMPSHQHGTSGHTHSFSGSLTGASVSGSISGSTGSADSNHTHSFGMAYENGWQHTGGFGTPFVAAGGSGSSTINTSGFSNNHAHSISGSISGGSVTGGSVSGTTGGGSGNTDVAGGGSGFSVLPPHLVLHYLVKL